MRLHLKGNICAQNIQTRLKICQRARKCLPTGSRLHRRRVFRRRHCRLLHRLHRILPLCLLHCLRLLLCRHRLFPRCLRNLNFLRVARLGLHQRTCPKQTGGTSYKRKGIGERRRLHTSISTDQCLESKTRDHGFKSSTRRINSLARTRGALWGKAIPLEKTEWRTRGTLSLRRMRSGSISYWTKPWTCVRDL